MSVAVGTKESQVFEPVMGSRHNRILCEKNTKEV